MVKNSTVSGDSTSLTRFTGNDEDLSTETGFQLDSKCDRCGKGYEASFKPPERSPMRFSWFGTGTFLGFALLAALSVGGCGTDGIIRPMAAHLQEMLNADQPNANDRILLEAAIGDPARQSTISEIAGGSGGPYCFRGELDGRWGVGILGADGSLVDFQSTIYSARSVCALSPTSPAPATFVVAGSHDNDGDGQSELGYVSLFSFSGSLLDQLLVSSDTSDVWLNSVSPLSDSTFIVAGGERRGSVTYPYLARVAVLPDRTLALQARKVLESQPNQSFDHVAVLPAPSGGTDLFLGALYAPAAVYDRIDGIRATLPDLADASVEWSRQVISSTGSNVILTNLAWMGGDLYVVGRADDSRKQPAPNDGGSWSSGLAASFTRGGVQRWVGVVGLSQHTETFSNLVATPDALLAVGYCAYYSHDLSTGEARYFGYGWISRIDPTTGEVAANLSVGPDRSSSGFSAAVYADGALTCAGWTGRERGSGPYRGWFCRVDVSLATATGAAGTAPVLEGATPGARRGTIPRDLPGARQAAGQ